MKYTIGEFSQITSLTVKTLRLYHEKGILIPAEIDEFTNYRYYNNSNYELAKTIKILRSYDFTLAEIKDILDECSSESEILEKLKEKQKEVNSKIARYESISSSIELIIQREKETKMNEEVNFEVEEKEIDTILIAGYRMKAKYDEVGKGFSIIGKKFGRHINGKPITLFYDKEYVEENADYEACFPIRKGTSDNEVSVRELKGGKCVSVIHKGPYDEIGEAYKKLINYVGEKGLKTIVPTRIVYIKGPGMIFKGNPRNYLSEVQFMLTE